MTLFRKTITAALATCALSTPALSHAAATPATTGHSRLQLAIQIADAHWPSSPCHGREQVVGVTDATVDGYENRALAYAPPDGTCRVLVAWDRLRGWPTRTRCRLLEHEFGHLAGHWHSTQVTSVMYPSLLDLRVNSVDCYRAFPSPYPTLDDDPHWRLAATGGPR